MQSENLIHYWQGEWISDEELVKRIENFSITPYLGQSLETEIVIEAADRLSKKIARQEFKSEFASPDDLLEIGQALARKEVEQKVKRELGGLNPFLISRVAHNDSIFEAWAPLGLLVHISPQNSFAVGVMSVLEGLLSGNVNFLKTGREESLFPQLFLEALAAEDETGTLKNYVIAAKISSKKTALISQVFGNADAIAIWGSEESVNTVRKQAPTSVKIIEWGHRISFIYLTSKFFSRSETLKDIALSCCQLEQQACSSPQCIYLDTNNFEVLAQFARDLAEVLSEVSKTVPIQTADDSARAEISMVTEVHRMETCFGKALLIEAENKEWRIFVDERPELIPSPLYRSIWVKPLPRKNLIQILRPMRSYLQTVGLAADLADIHELTRLIFAAGVTRIRKIQEMMGGYAGEPHDGVSALQKYCKRVSVQLDSANKISHFDELRKIGTPFSKSLPRVTGKEDFVSSQEESDLYFKSGGSSGEPKLSTFSYEEYDEHMWLGSQGLYSGGLDPEHDRCMNLFFVGGMSGGFISIFSSLERLRVPQFPMAAHQDLEMVANTIVKNQVNVLLGMPSYLMMLFEKNQSLLQNYRGIKKIFYGGEHFTKAQEQYLQSQFGIEVIRSGAYGSVDIGPMGYQCEYCENGVHHLQQRLHYLEILKLDQDIPVQGNEIGRLVFSPRTLNSKKPSRYAIGDVGQWVDIGVDHGVGNEKTSCLCGRLTPRFKLLGRTGDVFRVGSMFFNFQTFQKITAEIQNFSGEIQIHLVEQGLKEKIEVWISHAPPGVKDLFLAHYTDLNEAVTQEEILLLEVKNVGSKDFERSSGSGKLLRVIDKRTRR